MRSVSIGKVGAAILLPLSAAATSTFVSSLPYCWQKSIGAFSQSCGNQDLSCICYLAGSGSFLSDVSSSINDNCSDDDLDVSQIVAPLQAACNANGTPIPSSAIGSRSLPLHSSDSTEGLTTTTGLAYFTDSNGNSHTVPVPFVIGPSTTMYGTPSDMTSTSTSTSTSASPSSVTSNISVLGLPKSTISSVRSSTSSTATPTATVVPLSTTAASFTMASTTTSSASTSSISTSSSKAPSPSSNDGSLLNLQSDGTRREARSLLGLILGVVAGVAWF